MKVLQKKQGFSKFWRMKCGVDWRENINWSSKGGHSMADMIDTAAISMEDVSVKIQFGMKGDFLLWNI